jgi:phospholipid/cholesterol/gamma-HCH transport system substrate-binding protein
MNVSGYTKIALFFIVLGVGGGAYIITSADTLSDFNVKEYETIVADATGLSTRSKIYQAGVVVGRVKGITLDGNEAILRIALLKNLEVREGASIARKSSSILGTSILTIDPGGNLYPVIPPGGRINAAKEAGDMNAVMGTVQDLGTQISEILREFQQNQLAMLAISLETFNSIAQRLERIMEQGELYGTGPAGDIYVTLENLRVITEEISRGDGNVGQAIFDEELYKSLLSTMQEIEVAVIKLQETLDSINTAATGANNVIENASVIVERAVGLGVQVDTFGRYFTQASQVQAGASLRIVPTSNDRWYRIGVSSLPNGRITRTVSQFNGGGNDELIETEYPAFAIDAELARQFKFLTVRGGLIENTGGIGLDIQPIKWVSISGEVFDFKTGEAPNLRGTITIYPFFDPDSDKPWNWLYIRGGISNSLSGSRDFFIGGGMRFADREVKGLVGLIPALNN